MAANKASFASYVLAVNSDVVNGASRSQILQAGRPDEVMVSLCVQRSNGHGVD